MAEKLPAYATPDQIPAVVDNLTSDSTTSALSAAKGKALKSDITALTNSLAYSYKNLSSSSSECSYTANVIFKKRDNIVIVQINGFLSLPVGGYTTICTVPEGFRNKGYGQVGDFCVVPSNSGGTASVIRLYIDNSNHLQAYNYSSSAFTNNNFMLVASYVLP